MRQIDEEAGRIKEGSVIDNYLKSIQDRTKEDNKQKLKTSIKATKKIPKGTFWVQRKNPGFILKDQLNVSADILHQPRVFYGLLHHLVSDLKCPKCSTFTKFYVKEWNIKPRARRIVDLDK